MYEMALTKVGELEFATVIYEQILWLQVSMENTSLVAVFQASKDLKEK